MWSNQGTTFMRSSGEGTSLYHQLQPPAARAPASARTTRALRMADLLGARGAQEPVGGLVLVGGAGHEDADPVVGELRVEGEALRRLEGEGEDHHPRDGRERAEQDGQL